MKWKNSLIVLIVVLFTVIGVYCSSKEATVTAPQDVVVARLWAQSLPDTTGKAQPMSQWKGKALLVNFWATWCAPCVQEMPELSALQTEVSSKNIQIIGIGVDSAANISEFLLKYKISYPLYVAGMNGAELSRLFGNQVGGLPFTVLIGADGHIKKTYSGRLKLDLVRKDLALF